MDKSYLPSDFLPVLVQIGVAVGFIIFTMVVAPMLGPNRKTKRKNEVFECGIESVGDARTPISIKYFLTAILFVLFDVEIIFMYPWAVNFKGLGMDGFIEMIIFMLLLLAGFYYVIKKGILNWEK
jgi:NADH-quinone oxidoreductase subunit A